MRLLALASMKYKNGVGRCLIKRFPDVLYGIFTSIILIFAKLKSLTGGFVYFFYEDELVDLYYKN